MAAAEIAAGPVRRKESGCALPDVIRTQGTASRMSGMGRGWLVGPTELGVVHGAEERGELVE